MTRSRRALAANVAVADTAGTNPGEVGTVDVGVGSVAVVVMVSVTVIEGVTAAWLLKMPREQFTLYRTLNSSHIRLGGGRRICIRHLHSHTIS